MQFGIGSHPIQSFVLGLYGSSTIAASAAGTAAATVITASASLSYAKAIEIWNLTGANLDLVFGPDNTTATYTNTTPNNVMAIGNGTFFCPGNATVAITAARGERMPIAFTQGMSISVRTTNNTPVTCSATAPLVINLWA